MAEIDMRFQQRPYWCGPASIQNALRALGSRVGQERIAKIAGSTKEDGTDEKGIFKALSSLGYKHEELTTDVWNHAKAWIDDQIIAGRPVLLCIESWQHWVCIVGGLGGRPDLRYIVVDPARYEHNKSENGVHSWGWKRLAKDWRAGHRTAGSEGAYYAISVGQ